VPLFDELDFNFFAVNRQRYKNDFTPSTRNACTAERDILNLQLGVALWKIGCLH
jgi:hypothetical protein